MPLIITIELQSAIDGHRETLGTARIGNDGTGTEIEGNYVVRIFKWGRPGRTWKHGKVVGFPRKRLGPWDLLLRALLATVGNRN